MFIPASFKQNISLVLQSPDLFFGAKTAFCIKTILSCESKIHFLCKSSSILAIFACPRKYSFFSNWYR